jgi:hypothetical protein
MTVEEFLSVSGFGPEYDALRRTLGSDGKQTEGVAC